MEGEEFPTATGSTDNSTGFGSCSTLNNCLICGGYDVDCDLNSKPDSCRLPPHALDGLIRLLRWRKADFERSDRVQTDPGLERRLRAAKYCMKCAHDLHEVYSLLERLQELKTKLVGKLRTCYSSCGLDRQKTSARYQELRAEILKSPEVGLSCSSSLDSRICAKTVAKRSEATWTPNGNKRLRMLTFARELLAPDPPALAQVQIKVESSPEPNSTFVQEPNVVTRKPPRRAHARARKSPVVLTPSGTRIAKKKKAPSRKRASKRARQENMKRISAARVIKRRLAKIKSETEAAESTATADCYPFDLNCEEREEEQPSGGLSASGAIAKPQPRQRPHPRPHDSFHVVPDCPACKQVGRTRRVRSGRRVRTPCHLNCFVCGEPTGRLAVGLQAHMRAAHPNVPWGQGACGVCKRKSQNLTLHHVSIHQAAPFRCRTCGEEFSAFLEYNHHLRSHPELGLPPVQCEEPNCGRVFTSHKSLMHHIHHRHDLVLHPFHCDRPGCASTFRSAADLEYHVRRKHEGALEFPCELCHRRFPIPSLLRDHVRLHAGTEPRNHVCPQPGCGKAFRLKGKLSDHQAAVHGAAPKEHVCDQCGKSFPVKNYLYIHLRSHETPEEKRARRLKAEQAREERRRSGLPILTAKGRPRTRPVRERDPAGYGRKEAPVTDMRQVEDQPPSDKNQKPQNKEIEGQDQGTGVTENLLRQAATN